MFARVRLASILLVVGHGGSGNRPFDGGDGRRQARAREPEFESRVKPGEWARAGVVAECQPEVQWRARSSQRTGARRRRQTSRPSPDPPGVAGYRPGRLVTTSAPGCHRCGRSLCGRGPRRHRWSIRTAATRSAPCSPPSHGGSAPTGSRSTVRPPASDLTLRLRRDDVAIDGRILGLEGKPLASLTIRAESVADFPAVLLKKLRENAGKMNPGLWGEMRDALNLGNNGLISPVRTGIDGRFHLTGVGRDRAVVLLIEGESIEQSIAMAYTSSDRAYTPPLLPADGSGESRLFGPRFDLTVAPAACSRAWCGKWNRAGRSSAPGSGRGRSA